MELRSLRLKVLETKIELGSKTEDKFGSSALKVNLMSVRQQVWEKERLCWCKSNFTSQNVDLIVYKTNSRLQSMKF